MATQTYVDGVTLTAGAELNAFDTAAYSPLTGVGGTGNAITATGPANYSLSSRQVLSFVPAATNSGTTQLTITPSGGAALTIKNVFANGAACSGGEIVINVPCQLMYDGTQYNILNPARAITLATSQASTSGTSIDFTGIPAGVKRVTLMLVGVSLSGTSDLRIQLGGGSVETTGYLGANSVFTTTTVATANATSGFEITLSNASAVVHGAITFSLEKSSTFTWVASGIFGRSDGAVANLVAGRKLTAAVLDRVRVTTVNGSDTFDAGEINISYE